MEKVDDTLVFIAIVEAGSFHRAASKLNMSPSAVSRQLKRIEGSLGIPLLQRTTRSLSVTPQGEMYYHSCKRIEEERRTTQQQMQDLTAKPVGRLKLTVTPAFNYAQLISAIGEFRSEYPDISFDIQVSDKHLDLASEGIDIAIRIGLLQDSRLKARKLMRSCLIPCASPEYLACHEAPRSIEDLEHHMLITSSHLHSIEKRQTELSQLVLDDAQKVLVVNDVMSIYRAVMEGIGMSFLPDYLISHDLEAGTLLALLPNSPRASHDVYALFSNSEYLPIKTRLFIDFLVRRFNS